VVSAGSLIDISWTEWLDYLAHDPHTHCIGIYMERLEDGRSFFAAAREVALRKPIVLIKSGRSSAGDVEDRVFDEACRSNGVLRVYRFNDLFRLAALLTSQPVPRGRRLVILSNARGPAVLAADEACAAGGRLAPLAPETVTQLSGILRARWDGSNPIDAGSDCDAARFVHAAAVAADDPNADALLVLLAPQVSIDPVEAAKGLRCLARAGKPILTCWMWEAANPESLALLREAGIPAFRSPESAVRTFGYLWRHSENLRFLGELREALGVAEEETMRSDHATEVVAVARSEGRDCLTEDETEELFSAYGLPIDRRYRVGDVAGALAAADALGYPVLLELTAGGAVPHGSEGESVRLRAADPAGVRRAVRSLQMLAREHFGIAAPTRLEVLPVIPADAIELAVSSTAHRDLGQLIVLSRTGPGAAAAGPVVRALAPLTPLTAQEMIERGAVPVAELRRPGGHAIDLDAAERFLLRLSRLAAEQPWIRTITVGSLLLWDRHVAARCVRVEL
jgi:acetyltransferase